MADPGDDYGYIPYPPEHFLYVDWKETPEAHIFKADVPGVRKEDVRVELDDGNMLMIISKFNMDDIQEDQDGIKMGTYYCQERPVGEFGRHCVLPEDANVDRVEAELKDGVLTVTVPKKNN